MKFILLKAIRAYQALSRSGASTPFLFGGFSGCRSWPTCSEFALEAISRNGVIKGGAQSLRRVVRCNPFVPVTHQHS